MEAMNNSGGIPLLCLRDRTREKCLTLSVAPLQQMDQKMRNQKILTLAQCLIWHTIQPTPTIFPRVHSAHGHYRNHTVHHAVHF